LDKTDFPEGKRVGSFEPVQPDAAALAFGAGALLALAALALVALRRSRTTLEPGVRALLASVPDGLGDAALLLDADGFIVAGNGEAARLAGVAEGRLAGVRAAAVLGEDVAILQRGAARGPTAARVTLRSGGGASRGRAVVARVASRPARYLAVLRLEPPEAPAPRPPPLPVATPPPTPPARAAARVDLAAVGAALREPAGRAATAASMLRLLAPSLPARTESELARLEAALGDLERRLAALAAAGAAARGEPRAVDLAVLVSEAVAGLPGSAVRLRTALAPAEALVDATRLRAALREIVRAALDVLPAGGEVAITVAPRWPHAVVEIASPGSGAASEGSAAAVARALLGPEGGHVDVEVIPGRGRLCRIAFPAVRAGATPAATSAHATPSFL
jgi:signal transduction histidine kinase